MSSFLKKFKSGFTSAASPPSPPANGTTHGTNPANGTTANGSKVKAKPLPLSLPKPDLVPKKAPASSPQLSLTWIDLGLESTPKAGDGLGEGAGSGSGGTITAKIGVEEFGRVKLTPEEVQAIWEKGGRRIMDGGLTSLGLFRPYRLSENPTNIRRLISLYLLSLPTSSPSHAQLPAKSALRGWSGLSETEGEGEGWQKEMERANISDVAVVLKWALRHLDYGSSSFGSSTSLGWYATFVEEEKKASFPPRAYSTILLPSLPAAHGSLLSSVLSLIGAIASHSEYNGMHSSRLCFILSGWLFGIKSGEYAEWKKAGEALEHVWLAWVREEGEGVRERESKPCLVGLGERGRRGSEGEGVEAWKAGKERGTSAEIGGSGQGLSFWWF
ncbi:hypothetical protein BT69DRAFT_490820 [Atractiella rhizophila]|nr:hypothetical protein BT69DRAFT_490820 [Atractiella rhizophila]